MFNIVGNPPLNAAPAIELAVSAPQRLIYSQLFAPNLGSIGVLAISSLALALFSAIALVTSTESSTHWTESITTLTLIWSVIYLVTTRKAARSFYLISSAFLLLVMIFHLSHIIVHALGIERFTPFVRGEMKIWYIKGGWCILMAVGCYGIGVALGLLRGGYRFRPATVASIERNYALVYWCGLGLVAASLVAIIHLVLTVGNIFAHTRAELFSGVGDTRGFGFALFILPSGLLLLAISARTSQRKVYVLGISAVLSLFVLFLGYRSSVLFPGLIGLILWRKSGGRIPVLLLVGALIFVLLVIPAIKHLRQMGAYNQIDTQDLASSFVQSEGVGDVFIELGAIAGVVSNVLMWVPAESEYRWGHSYARAFWESVPNLGLSISQSTRSMVGQEIDAEDLRPSEWYIYKYNRWMFKTGGGGGFSAVAEAYYNFGYAGVVIIFLLFGYWLVRIDVSRFELSPSLMVFCCIGLWPLLTIVRNEFSNFVKPTLFAAITILLWLMVTRWKVNAIQQSRRSIQDRRPFAVEG
jgi:oligosaccharide repeat unit polymerase